MVALMNELVEKKTLMLAMINMCRETLDDRLHDIPGVDKTESKLKDRKNAF